MVPVAFFIVLGLCAIGWLGIQIVPQQNTWVIQRLGKFHRMLGPGPNWIIPLVDTVAYRHTLKEEAIEVPEQMAITQDNVSVILDGIVYVKIADCFAASYGVKDPRLAVTQLVQTTMRSEVGKLPLDKTFEARDSLNARIVNAINEAAVNWGIRCIRYEIKDIKMPDAIRTAMELQMTAERQKRAQILASEGVRQSHINESEGQRQAIVNLAQANKERVMLEAHAALAVSEATAQGILAVSTALDSTGGDRAASLQLADKYIKAFGELAKHGTTVLLPSNMQHPATFIAEAMTIYDKVKGAKVTV